MTVIKRILIASTTLFLLTVVVGCGTVTHSPSGTTTTIILTRHSDRDPMVDELNDKGRLRAKALVEAVAELKISAIYSPDLKRNLQTAEPLAEHLGLEVKIIGLTKNTVTKTILTRHPGETAIWIGNKNNLKGIYQLLGGEGAPPTSYGDLYIMEIRDSGKPTVTKRRYGPL